MHLIWCASFFLHLIVLHFSQTIISLLLYFVSYTKYISFQILNFLNYLNYYKIEIWTLAYFQNYVFFNCLFVINNNFN